MVIGFCILSVFLKHNRDCVLFKILLPKQKDFSCTVSSLRYDCVEEHFRVKFKIFDCVELLAGKVNFGTARLNAKGREGYGRLPKFGQNKQGGSSQSTYLVFLLSC